MPVVFLIFSPVMVKKERGDLIASEKTLFHEKILINKAVMTKVISTEYPAWYSKLRRAMYKLFENVKLVFRSCPFR